MVSAWESHTESRCEQSQSELGMQEKAMKLERTDEQTFMNCADSLAACMSHAVLRKACIWEEIYSG